MVQLTNEEADITQPLLSYAIIEKGTEHDFVKQHLKEINSNFLNRFALNDIFSKDPEYFMEFKSRIDEILGDLRLKIDDRIRSIFRY